MPFYNTAPPTSSSKNNITDIAVTYGIRDFLLNKNLLPVYPMALNNSPGTVRIGEPILDTMVGTGNVVVPFGLPLETNGILRMEIAVLPNQFKNTSSTVNDLQTIDYLPKLSNPDYPNANFPQGIESYPTKPTTTIEQYGIQAKTVEAGWRKNANLLNLYLDVDGQVDAAAWFDQKPAPISQQVKGYLDTYGGLNLGGSAAIQASSVIGSVLNGQGLGLAKGGVVTNYDVRSSLAGRVLGATGLINDTKLGMIGGQQLALALANNAAFNVQQQALGALNVQDNVLSLVKDGTLAGFRPNYQITVPSGDLGKVADYTAKILGFTLPKSYLQDAGSIFLSESNSANIERANSMILNTGKGQVAALISNINVNLIGTGQYDNPDTTPFRSGYAPGYKDNRGEDAINANLYAFYNSDKSTIYNFLVQTKGIIPEISYNRSGMIKDYGFTGPEENIGVVNPYEVTSSNNPNLKGDAFTWGSNVGGTVNSENSPFGGNIVTPYLSEFKKKNLLAKTQMLFDDAGMKTIVSGFGDINPSMKASQINTANGGGISKGSAVISGSKFDEDGQYTNELDSPVNTYCRTWTTKLRYDAVTNLVRSSGLNTTVPYRFQTQNSSLDQYGFAKIAPYITDSQKVGDPKNYMFSIENLAWHDSGFQNLLPVEQGPGDLMTGKRGRIMWFPPYNIQFSENTSVSWESNSFIGRGEPVYTYNNTERSGQLSFSIVVDHPSYVNSFRGSKGPDDNYVASFFAGCVEPSQKFADKLTVAELSELSTRNITEPQKQVLTPETPPEQFEFFYPNDYADVEGTLAPINGQVYENGLSGTSKIDYHVYTSGNSIGSFVGGVTSKTAWNDNENYGLNGWQAKVTTDPDKVFSGVTDPAYFPALKTYLETKCPHCKIKITSYASPQGSATANEKLANGRTESMYNFLKKTLFSGKKDDYIEKRLKKEKNYALTNTSCVTGKDAPVDTYDCKIDRKTLVEFVYDAKLHADETAKPADVVKTQQQQISTKITNRFYNEGTYFEQLTDADAFVFDRFRDKIKYFHPAFHSTTPEGLNSRLTFLQQCTRQGPTLENVDANNLAFGRPPICILRIGDFYNTKIVIDSVAIDYEPLVWDLNPEGVGVQPMIANVSLSFKFIGGSTLAGPINKLQNALSFNYYANAHVYDPRADYIAKISDISESLKGKDRGLGKPEVSASIDGEYGLVKGMKKGYGEPTITTTQTDIGEATPVTDQAKQNETNNSGAGAVVEPLPAGAFTVDNISLQGDNFMVSPPNILRPLLLLKTDSSNVVIKPTKRYQIDIYMIHEMQPKGSWTTNDLLYICANDLVGNVVSEAFMGSAVLAPEGIEIIDENGKKNVTEYHPVLDITQKYGSESKPESKTALLNCINQTKGIIDCNLKNPPEPKPITVDSEGKSPDQATAIKIAILNAKNNVLKQLNLTSGNITEIDGGTQKTTLTDGTYITKINRYIGKLNGDTPQSSIDKGFRLKIVIKEQDGSGTKTLIQKAVTLNA